MPKLTLLDKEPPKMLLGSFCAHLLLGMDLPLRVFCFPSRLHRRQLNLHLLVAVN